MEIKTIMKVKTVGCGDETYKDLLESRDFPPLKNDTILRAIKGEPVDRIPVWIMRQAGRYLPEFRQLRKEYSFFDICASPHLACEVTLMPLKRFDLDAAIIFSDILEIPKALGMMVDMTPKGPEIEFPLTISTMHYLCSTQKALQRLKHVGDAITLTRHKLEGRVPLFGFAGAPWTLMCYMIEGGGSKTQAKAKQWLYAYPEEAIKLIESLTDLIIPFLTMQVQHGAQILQLFDSNAEYLNRSLYMKFCYNSLRKIAHQVTCNVLRLNLPRVPIILFAKGASYCLEDLAELPFDALQIDWTVNPAQLNKPIFENTTIQGNLDPCALFAPKTEIYAMTEEMVKTFGPRRYIANLGHGIYPDIPMDAVKNFVDAVHSIKFDEDCKQVKQEDKEKVKEEVKEEAKVTFKEEVKEEAKEEVK